MVIAMNKVILITGASSGIGHETAALLASQGHKVYAAARRVERMEDLAAAGVTPVKLDVTDAESVKAAVRQVTDEQGRIDVLINNAGYGYFGPIENVSDEEARKQLDVNIFGLANLTREVLPWMRKQGGGRIVNTASIAGKFTLMFGGWYSVSKYAVEAFSDALRMEVKPFGIDIVTIEPGGIKTAWGTIAADHLDESCKGTAYEDEGKNMAALLRFGYTSDYLSPTSVVAKAMSKAVNAKRPRTRYRIGFASHFAVFWHSVLSDRQWDAIMRCGGKIMKNRRLK